MYLFFRVRCLCWLLSFYSLFDFALECGNSHSHWNKRAVHFVSLGKAQDICGFGKGKEFD